MKLDNYGIKMDNAGLKLRECIHFVPKSNRYASPRTRVTGRCNRCNRCNRGFTHMIYI